MSYQRNLQKLYWHSFFTDFSLWSPIAILYFARVSGSYALGLSVYSVSQITGSIMELPTGVFSDYFGRRKTILAGAFFFTLSLIFYAIGLSYAFLLIGAVMQGVASAFYSGNNDALVYDNLSHSKQLSDLNKWFGKIGSMSQAGLAVSGVLGGILANKSFSLVVWLSVIPQIVCIILAWQLKEVSESSKENDNPFIHFDKALRNFIGNSKLRLISLYDIISFGVGEASFQFRAAFVATVWPIWAIGFSQVFSNIGAAISFRISHKIINRLSPTDALIIKSIYNRLMNLTALLFPTPVSPALMASNSLFYGVGSVATSNLMQSEFTQEQRATMGSLNSLFGKLLFSFFAVGLGFAADRLGAAHALLIGEFIGIINLSFLFALKRHAAPKLN